MHLPDLAGAPGGEGAMPPERPDALHCEEKDRMGAGRLRVGGCGLDGACLHAMLQVPERLLRALHVHLHEVGHLDHTAPLILEHLALAAASVLEQVSDDLVVDLEKGDLHLERHLGLRVEIGVAVAAGRATGPPQNRSLQSLEGPEHLGHGTEDKTPLPAVRAAEHRVGLARTRGPVDEDRRRAALLDSGVHERLATPSEDIALRRIGAEDLVEAALLDSPLLGL
mmetsp:Transcript_18719/g.54135  ORF Transcript_18719/g.54135 Transcript_18719/m.54135 type:complete len:225 (-) Transcript_18719:327-1001(-)